MEAGQVSYNAGEVATVRVKERNARLLMPGYETSAQPANYYILKNSCAAGFGTR